MSNTAYSPDASVKTAVEDLIESGQQLMLDRLDLMRLEVKDGAQRALRKATFVTIASLLGLSGWVALSVAAVLGLSEIMPMAAAALVIGLSYVAAAGVFWLGARSRLAKVSAAFASPITRAAPWQNPTMQGAHASE